jgi:PAS domain S-box-containing protein
METSHIPEQPLIASQRQSAQAAGSDTAALPVGLHEQSRWFDDVTDAVFIADERWQIQYWNRAAEQLYGWTRDHAVGRPAWEVIAVQRLLGVASTQALVETLDRVGEWRGRAIALARDGHDLEVAGSVRSIATTSGAIQGYIGISRDVTERAALATQLQVAHHRLAVLSQASLTFAAATTSYPDLLTSITTLVSNQLAAGVVIRLISDDAQWLRIAAVSDYDPEVQAAVVAIDRHDPVRTNSANLAAVVASSGHPLLMPTLEPALILESATPAEQVAFTRIRPQSTLIVPLRADGRVTGTLSLTRYSAGQPPLTEDDLALAQDLADRAALAIRNAQLFQTAQNELERRQRAEQSLQASEERFAVAFHTSSVPFAITEAATGRYLAVNVALQHLLGYEVKELIGQTSHGLAVLVDPAERATLQDEIAAHGMFRNRIIDVRTKSGEVRQVLTSAALIMFDQTACYFSVLSDLTDRVRAEQALAAEQRRVIQLKNAFLATMSHELRTPLNTVLGPAELLLDGTYGKLSAPQTHAIQQIAESGQHLLALLNDILDYATVESGHAVIECAPTPVVDLCRASVQQVMLVAQQKQIAPIVEIDQTVALIDADGRRLRQILINLLANAVKFTPDGGQVGLEVHGDRDLAQVTFTVWDTGIGIEPDNLRLLFQPFTQIDNRLNRTFEGTGLGLALVRKLVDAHGGSIAVETTLGAGSRFSVTLPWERETSLLSATPMTWHAPEAAPGNPILPATNHVVGIGASAPRILIMVDDEANRPLLQQNLAAHGFSTSVATDGAREILAAGVMRPDLILLDRYLHGMDGIETLQQIRADEALRNTPIILVTALVLPGDRERCFAAGASAYLAKPIHSSILMATIQHVL